MWEDENGITQIILRGKWGEQEDALMPLQFEVGQHVALVNAQLAMHWSRLRKERSEVCGKGPIHQWAARHRSVGNSPVGSKTSKCWGHHWDTPISSPPIFDGKIQKHELLFSRIPAVPDLQLAWALLKTPVTSSDARLDQEIRQYCPLLWEGVAKQIPSDLSMVRSREMSGSGQRCSSTCSTAQGI